MGMTTTTTTPGGDGDEARSRRDFLYLTAGAGAAVGAGAFAWALIDGMNPAADTLSLSTTDVDLAPIQQGQAITVTWRGKPVFVRYRTPEDIEAARAVPVSELRDPQTDQDRVKPGKQQWLIMVGICTHLGCIPLGQNPADSKGDFGGWFCPCHGSHYDSAGRIRKGPAPLNLAVPRYEFTSDTTVRIG